MMHSFYGNPKGNKCIVYLTHSKIEDSIISYVEENDFYLLHIIVDNWNDDLSPWYHEAVFGKENFNGKGKETLMYIKEIIITLGNYDLYLCGYSLAGLFSLWAAYECDLFKGIASVSGSLWFKGFIEYTKEKDIKTSRVYLSLGDKEAKARNVLMSLVEKCSNDIYLSLKDDIPVRFDINPGNHFKDPDLRMIKAFDWLINN